MRRLVILAAACIALASCSSSSHHDATANGPGATPSDQTSASAGPSASATASGSPSANGSASPGGSAAPGGGTTGSQPGTSGAAPHPVVSTTAPGTYTLDTTGTIHYGALPIDASGTSTYTVAAASAGVQRTTQHSDKGGDQVQDMSARSSGTYLSYLKISNQAFTKEFTASPAVLLFPSPARIGSTWSWSLTSSDRATTAATTNKILRTETLVIGGVQVPTVVLETHLVISGDVSYTADVTTWISPKYRLPVKDHQVGSGTANNVKFTTDITDVMRSVSPS